MIASAQQSIRSALNEATRQMDRAEETRQSLSPESQRLANRLEPSMVEWAALAQAQATLAIAMELKRMADRHGTGDYE